MRILLDSGREIKSLFLSELHIWSNYSCPSLSYIQHKFPVKNKFHLKNCLYDVNLLEIIRLSNESEGIYWIQT